MPRDTESDPLAWVYGQEEIGRVIHKTDRQVRNLLKTEPWRSFIPKLRHPVMGGKPVDASVVESLTAANSAEHLRTVEKRATAGQASGAARCTKSLASAGSNLPAGTLTANIG
jgi:hypothetical protein